ncbi:hypothetical protein W97_02460 [Coniosporium apollinis CBS 100218]|uniref:D-aminoacyl-tRNA deacylase n=1 Tax=Coniosporium apollinis (strain CBS 100218) TaxID=1168221 RepID=R7YMZ5_CONA1|nr:uncharacterized protein W97_02460 [Coniosporium apollinis CBS 100218]EON63233.1 hypothetical protein W97_02460 [Coniosporium apollinis CBS 100218]
MAGRVLKMKMWDDDEGGRWKKSVQEVGGEILCVSQFTLLASTKKGNKPDFHKSASGVKAKELYATFFEKVQRLYQPEKVKDGVFQAMMDVALVNDGPVGEDQPPKDPNAPEYGPMGVEYTCLEDEVTLEIDTDPPKPKQDWDPNMPGGGKMFTLDELAGVMRKYNAEFVLPAELLE